MPQKSEGGNQSGVRPWEDLSRATVWDIRCDAQLCGCHRSVITGDSYEVRPQEVMTRALVQLSGMTLRVLHAMHATGV